MFKGERLRFKSAAVAIPTSGENSRKNTQIPAGAIVEIQQAPAPGGRLWEVSWNGHRYLMFDQDLRQRAERMKGQSAT